MPPRRGGKARKLRPVRIVRGPGPQIPRAVRPVAVGVIVVGAVILFAALRSCRTEPSFVVVVDGGPSGSARPTPHPATPPAAAKPTPTAPAAETEPSSEPAAFATPEPPSAAAAEPPAAPPVEVTPAMVDAAFGAVQNDVLYCYRRFYAGASASAPAMGMVTIRAEVGDTGDVLSCDAQSPSLSLPSFTACVSREASRAHFPPLAKGQRVTVSYTFRFQRQ